MTVNTLLQDDGCRDFKRGSERVGVPWPQEIVHKISVFMPGTGAAKTEREVISYFIV